MRILEDLVIFGVNLALVWLFTNIRLCVRGVSIPPCTNLRASAVNPKRRNHVLARARNAAQSTDLQTAAVSRLKKTRARLFHILGIKGCLNYSHIYT